MQLRTIIRVVVLYCCVSIMLTFIRVLALHHDICNSKLVSKKTKFVFSSSSPNRCGLGQRQSSLGYSPLHFGARPGWRKIQC